MSQIVLTLAKISKVVKILAKKRLNILTLANLSSLHKMAIEISLSLFGEGKIAMEISMAI